VEIFILGFDLILYYVIRVLISCLFLRFNYEFRSVLMVLFFVLFCFLFVCLFVVFIFGLLLLFFFFFVLFRQFMDMIVILVVICNYTVSNYVRGKYTPISIKTIYILLLN